MFCVWPCRSVFSINELYKHVVSLAACLGEKHEQSWMLVGSLGTR